MTLNSSQQFTDFTLLGFRKWPLFTGLTVFPILRLPFSFPNQTSKNYQLSEAIFLPILNISQLLFSIFFQRFNCWFAKKEIISNLSSIIQPMKVDNKFQFYWRFTFGRFSIISTFLTLKIIILLKNKLKFMITIFLFHNSFLG